MSSFSPRHLGARLAAQWPQLWPLHPVRLALLAALPVAVLAGSPQRVFLSAAIAAAYVFAAIATLRSEQLDRVVMGYLGVVAAWMVISWLRSAFLLHLQPDQLAYGTSKTGYFVLVVLPMAAAVALMIERAEAFWPTALAQVAVGSAVALVTLITLGSHFLGTDRYSWQGNLIALGTVVAVQRWPIQRFPASLSLGLLGIAGVMMAGSRQAVVALVAGLLLSAAFWAAVRYRTAIGSAWERLRAVATERYVLLPIALVLLTIGFLAVTYTGVSGIGLGASGTASSCHCVTDRFVGLESSAGDRDRLLALGARLFVHNPILGAGLGSFAGQVPDSLHTGQFYEYPHNVPLEVAAETGAIGFVLVFGPLLAGWILLFRHGVKRASAPAATVLVVLAVFFTVANLSGDIPSERGLWIFGLVAFKLGIDRLRRPERRALSTAA
ncbi:MAG TPA: O-antigen ligase family protein [Verrucomicrobiae bacterium]|nr:O-antigen ligase family protein [Verrucomicrobiae bacterium]